MINLKELKVVLLPLYLLNNELSDFNYQIKLKFLKPTWIQLRNKQDQIILQ